MKFKGGLQYVLIFLLSGCSKGTNAGINIPTVDQPILSIANISEQRLTLNSTYRFYLTLNSTSVKQVSVIYATTAGSAKPNVDFVPETGTLIIPANSNSGYIDIPVVGDSLRQSDLQFTLVLSSPQNCVLNNTSATATIISTNGTYLPTDNAGYTTPISYPGKTLLWNDEFNSSNINGSNWNFETGGGGWGNQELENYTSRTENVFVSNGNLIIEARKENMGNNIYTSARMNTKAKKEFQYGRIDIRAKLPVAKGLWPALWMLGANNSTVGWPKCGETDIMELVGTYPSRIYSTMHWANSISQPAQVGGQYQLTGEDFSNKFHVFSLVWVQDSLKFFVDDNLLFTFSKSDVGATQYPFNSPSYIIFNVAVGGQWPGTPDPTTSFPQRMFVDYIRVFQ